MSPVGESRGVRSATVRRHIPYTFDLAAQGPGGGYRVHFGAARDYEKAREVATGDGVNGVFTTALAREIIARPDATFGDLATAVRLKVAQAGYKSQHPQAEGALRATLTGGVSRVALFEARPSGSSVVLAAGRILGMTEGSEFALYDSERAALAPQGEPLARGTIAALDDGQATIDLTLRPRGPLPDILIARETDHAFGDDKLLVTVPACLNRGASALVMAVKGLGFADIAPGNRGGMLALTSENCTDMASIRLFTEDATLLSALGRLDDPGFPDRLRQALLAIYNAHRLASLPSVSADEAGIGFCLSDQLDHSVRSCPTPASKGRVVEVDRPLVMTVTNASDNARFVYVLAIDERYGISQLIPGNDGLDPPMAPNAPQRQNFRLDAPGLYRFVIIASDARINTGVLQQASVRHNLAGPCDPELETAAVCLAESAGGARDGTVPRLGKWSITIEDVLVDWPRPASRMQAAQDDGTTDPDSDQASFAPTPQAEPNQAEAELEAANLARSEEGGADDRIVGGSPAPAGSARWQAEIYTTYRYTEQDTVEDNRRAPAERYYLAAKENWEKIHRCGGVYIGDNFVLTAAHCVSGNSQFGTSRRVRLRTQDLRIPGLTYKIADWRVHAGFRNAEPYPNDIAILRIEADNLAVRGVDLRSLAIRPLDPRLGDDPLTSADSLRVTGWGRTKAREEGQSEIARDGTRNRMSPGLLQINQRLDTAACEQREGYRDILSGKAICAMSTGRDQDSCNGDSGGPMTVARGRERVLVGLVSWGRGCALPDMPAVYTDVSGYLTWIEEAKRSMTPRRTRP